MSRAEYRVGDVYERLAELPDGSVDLIVTSPPFLALRSYLPADHPDKHREIGSKATPAAFLSTLLALTREWRRVLAPHGSLCVELGDTYSGSGGAGGDYNLDGLREGQQQWISPSARAAATASTSKRATGITPASETTFTTDDSAEARTPSTTTSLPSDTRNRSNARKGYGGAADRVDALKPGTKSRAASGKGWPLDKSLCLLPTLYPASLAYGRNLLAPDDTCDPWRIRNLVVWHRSNPPVGALGDKVRPSTSYVTVACTSRTRWFDLDSERGAVSDDRRQAGYSGNGAFHDHSNDGIGRQQGPKPVSGGVSNPAGAPPLDCWIHDDLTDEDVWTIPTAPYKGSHYATFPIALPRRLINLMCPRQVCVTCGEPRRRIVGEAEYVQSRNGGAPAVLDMREAQASGQRSRDLEAMMGASWKRGLTSAGDSSVTRSAPTLGWTDCGHDNWRRGVVLDPFAGSGTTLAAASELGRDSIGIDLDARNLELARERCGLFLETDEVVA